MKDELIFAAVGRRMSEEKLEEIPLIYQPDIYPLLSMDDIELQQEMERVFPVDQ